MKRLPNILSALRILLAPAFFILYLQDSFLWAATGMLIFILAALTDYFDGYYARQYKVSSSLGTFLDPLADKILTFTGFICMPFIDSVQFPWWIIGVIVFRDILVTGLRIWSDYKGYRLQTSYSAKFKTLVQMIFLYVVLLTGILTKTKGLVGRSAQWLLDTEILGPTFVIVMIITVYTGIEYIFNNRRLFLRESGKI